MLRQVIELLAASFLLASPIRAQFPADSIVRSILRDRVENKRSTGIVVGLLEADGRTRVVAYNERAHGEPVFDQRTVFEIGSITKAFTGSLLADMVGRGEVKLDDPVSRFLPSSVRMPARADKQITLLDLATQTSGLPRLPGNLRPADMSNPYADYTVGDLYAFLSGHELTRDIGVQFEYSNLGVGLLGHVLALQAGKSYEALVKERLLDPLRMSSTAITLSAESKARLAVGHNPAGAVVGNWDLPTIAGAGALRSTVEDMLKFLAAHVDSTASPLSKRLQPAVRPQRPVPGGSIGFAWMLAPRPDRTIVWHNGGTGGYRTFAGFDQKNRRAVVVLTNSAIGADDIGLHLLDPGIPLQAAPATLPVVRKEISVSLAVLEPYVGEYQLAPNFAIVVTREGDRLFGQPTGQQRFQLWPESETDFFLKEVDAQVRFVKDSTGKVTSLILVQGGQQAPARKIR
ncbi:MAG: serine hydrolase [Gemmatimonadota bacterium]